MQNAVSTHRMCCGEIVSVAKLAMYAAVVKTAVKP